MWECKVEGEIGTKNNKKTKRKDEKIMNYRFNLEKPKGGTS